MPSEVIQIDFAQPLPTLHIHRRGELWLLVKFGPQPIGWVRTDSTRFGRTIAPSILGQVIAETLPRQILDAARNRAFERPNRAQSLSFSIVVTTHENPKQLKRLLQSLALLQFPRFEAIVVNQTPKTDAVADLCEQFSFVHHVVEPRPGLAYARNTGWQVARNKIVAYLDDNTSVDPPFLTALADNFADTRVECASALRLPATMNTAAANHFAASGVANQHLNRRLFRPNAWNANLWTELAHAAAGNTFAVRRDTLASMNGFDPALTRGQSLDLFTRLLRDGAHVALDTRAIAFDQRRATMSALRRSAFAFGYALAECSGKYFDDSELANVAALTLRRWARKDVLHDLKRNALAAIRFQPHERLHLILLEAAGAIAATRAYRRSLRHVRSETRRFVQRGIVRRAA